jgi:hypothetical protein
MMAPYRKILIEVAMPLVAINAASAREKSIRHGHPSTLQFWSPKRSLDRFPRHVSDQKWGYHYVRRPFGGEPDFGVTSVNYDLDKLLARAEDPK